MGWNGTLESEPFQEQSAGITAKSLLLGGGLEFALNGDQGKIEGKPALYSKPLANYIMILSAKEENQGRNQYNCKCSTIVLSFGS